MNYLVGAISSNYSYNDIKNWIKSSNFQNVQRVLICYNFNESDELLKKIANDNIEIITPDFDYLGNPIKEFNTNTGTMNIDNSYTLVHNIRFYHLWFYLENKVMEPEDLVMITDVKDIIFNRNPFDLYSKPGLYIKDEGVKYEESDWNKRHLLLNHGLIGFPILDKNVVNVGCWFGNAHIVKYYCARIYNLAIGRRLVADQSGFNILINDDKSYDIFNTDLLAKHLHVDIEDRGIKFDPSDLEKYSVVHQYDRDKDLLTYYNNKYEI